MPGGGQEASFDAIPVLKARNLLAVVKLGYCTPAVYAALQQVPLTMYCGLSFARAVVRVFRVSPV